MKLTSLICASFVILALVPATAHAGSMNLLLQPVAWWSEDFQTTVPLPADGYPGNHAGYYELEVSFTAEKAPGDKGWLNTAFSANVVGSSLSLIPGTWAAINPVRENPLPPSQSIPLYAVNQDAGFNFEDLQSIVISLANSHLPANHPFDRRNETGTPNAYPDVGYPSGLGRFFVHWDGLAPGRVELTNHRFMFSLLDNTAGPEQQGAGARLSFGPQVPEPMTITFLSLALLAAFGIWRRPTRGLAFGHHFG